MSGQETARDGVVGSDFKSGRSRRRERGSTGDTFAGLFTARQSYLVLELILGASDAGNKVPHPERRAIGLRFRPRRTNLCPHLTVENIKA